MAPNRINARWLRFISALLAFATLAVLGGCGGGSGAPNNPFKPPPTVPGPLSILPSTATVYSNTPAILTISGGVPPYFVVSSNTVILPVGASVTNGTIVLLPANVLADTAVLITAQDSAGTKATATVTVKPAPIFNTLTITPASAACGANTICSGQTATASVTVTGAGGVGIPNRQVKFEVVTGAFAIQSNDPANPLVSTLTVVSDQFGVARVIIQANANAVTQPALLRATELTTGNQQTAQFTIVQTINGSAVLSVVPATATITGPDKTTCSSGFRIDYYIYGGTPPYTVVSTFPNAVTLINPTVPAPGMPFSAITNGTCVDPLVFSIRDSIGLQTTATLSNVVGTTAPPTPPAPPPPNVSITPSSYTATAGSDGGSCPGPFTFVVQDGTPPYNVVVQPPAGQPAVTASPAVVTTSPGTTSIPGTGTINAPTTSGNSFIYEIFVGDSSSPQTFANARITCKAP
jgi:hypothetical protein